MKKVMLFGTFDILHKGHQNFFQQARQYGDLLIVCLGRDLNVLGIKGRLPLFNEKERLSNLKKTKWVKKVVLGDKKDFLKPILQYKPQVICLGYDQKTSTKELKKKLQIHNLTIKIVRLKSFKPHLYKSSILRKKYVGY
ncbi:MAG: adenylyltransferase/cytidyltransferase family protein [Candidatus Magasanikbacteria bacterium]|nr:adenylyltransferase/cytidyltransferase family protein [Candidatus Magasanikbacteria bacterium]